MAQERIGVTLEFNANVTAAKKAMNELQSQLNSISNLTRSTAPGDKMAQDLTKASVAAAHLSTSLSNAFNVSTGKLDLSKFNQSLARSGVTLQQLKANLALAGTQGQQAFTNLTTQIATAEATTFQLSKGVQRLLTSFANVARYQISSMAFSAITSALSDAYRYSQDLNESLNDIRIVTGYNIQQMDKFAKSANKAAKELSTTTTKYADASLIFFQQGLTDAEVEERTRATIKLANVTGESVESISNQLTAVWNNFDDGTKSLEYYADVITALGAATASSSSEITDGLEKFAAIAETVGLSYEYATSALATVTATTRQSADVVGTAFKTLFARIQDLELGNTLDDGTTLGQYSAALEAVGVDIMDANGNLKQMNDILDELGGKWTTLSKDQQVALAQTVAGTRQYTQLVALMDNWGQFQENLTTAMTSSGALDQQAKIYEESWAAARDRVTASLETIYDKLLNDEFFIDVTDFFAGFIDAIGKIIDGLGGVKGVLLTISAITTKVMADKISTGINTAILAMTNSPKKTKSEAIKLASEEGAFGKGIAADSQSKATKELIKLTEKYAEVKDRITESEREAYELLIGQAQMRTQGIIEAGEDLKESQSRKNLVVGRAATQAEKIKAGAGEQVREYAAQSSQAKSGQLLLDSIQGSDAFSNSQNAIDSETQLKAINEIINRLNSMGVAAEKTDEQMKKIYGDEAIKALEQYEQELQEAKQELEELTRIQKKQKDGKQLTNEEKSTLTLSNLTEEDIKDIKIAKRSDKSINNIKKKKKRNEVRQQTQSARDRLSKKDIEFSSIDDKQLDQVEKKLKKTTTGLEAFSKQVEKNNKAAKASGEALKDLEIDLEGVDQQTNLVAEETHELVVATGESAEQTNGFVEGLKKAAGEMPSLGEGIQAAANVFLSLGAVISTVQSTLSILSDDTATTGEKITAVITAIATTIPLLTTALNKETLAQMASLSARMLGITLKEGEIVATKDGIGAKIADTIATWAQKAAQDGLNTSIITTYTLLFPLLIILAAVAAAIAIVVVAAKALSDAYNADAIAAEKAGERVEELTSAFDEARNSAERLKNTISDYTDALKALDELEYGTEEYAAALEDANEKARNLIETYGLWDDYDPNGGKYGDRIVFNPGVLERAQMEANAKASAARSALYAAKIQANDANLTKQATDIGRKEAGYITTTTTDAYGQQYTTLRSATSDEVKTFAQALEDFKEDNAGIGPKNAEELKKYMRDAKESYQLSTEAWNSLDTVITDQTIGAFERLVNSINEADAANKYYAEQIMNANVKNLYGEKIAEMAGNDEALANVLSNTITALVSTEDNSKELQEKSKAIYAATDNTTNWNAGNEIESAMKEQAAALGIDLTDAETYAKIFGAGKTYSGNINAQQMLQDFYEAQGYSGVSVKNKSGKSVVTYTTTDENGQQKVETQEVTNEAAQKLWSQEIAKFLVSQVSEQLAGNTLSVEDAQKYLQPLIDNGEQFGANFTQALLSGIQSGGKFNFEGLFGELSPSEYEKLLAMDEQQLMTAFGLTPEHLEKLGFDSATAFHDAFDEALSEWEESDYISAANRKGEQKAEGLDIDVDEFKAYRQLLLSTNEAYRDNVEGLNAVALANKRLEKGIGSLSDDWSEINEVMSDGNADMIALSRILPKVNSALVDVLNIDTEDFALLPPDFAQKHWKLIEDVMNGVEGSVDKLRDVAGQEILVNVTGASDFTQIDESLQMLQKQIAVYDSIGAFEIGVPIDNASFIRACNEILKNAKMTSEQAQAYFAAMGYDVEVTTDKDGLATAVKVITANGSYGGGIGVNTSGGRDTSKIQKKKYDDEIERFYKEKHVIEDIQRELDRLSKAKDRAYGANKIAAIDAETAQLEKMIIAQKEYNAAVEKQLSLDEKAIKDLGFRTGANGQISNYEEVMRQAIDSYNRTGDEEAYNKIVDAVEKYNESLDLMKDGQEKLLDLQYELQDLALEKITYEVEYKIELNDADLKRLEWQLKKLDDPINDAVEAIGLLGDTLQKNLDNLEVYKKGIKDIFASSGLNPEDIDALITKGDMSVLENVTLTEAQVEALQEYRDALYECYEALDAFYDEIMNKVNEAFEKMNEEAEETISYLEHLGSTLESYQNIVDIVGAKALGMTKASLQALSKAQVESSKATLEALKSQLDVNRSALAEAEAARDAAVKREDERAAEAWEEQIKIIKQSINELEESVNSAWGDALQAAAENFQLAVEIATQSFEESMSGIYGSFEKMQEAYNQQKEISQRYVSDYQKIYELSKLNRDLSKSISEIDSIKGKRALMELQEEINGLQESGVELSEHDLEFLQKKYELRQAEIALEEAQNAKSQVRMQRDAEGNWGYVYTADANKTAEAEQSYEDKLYEIQKLEQDYLDEMEAAAIQAQIDMVDAINSIRREDFESEEAYMKEVNKVRQYYSELYGYYMSETDKALSNSATIYEEDWATYSDKTGYKIVADQEWRDQFSETFTAQVNGYKTADDARATFEQNTLSMCTKLKDAFIALELEFTRIFSALGHSFEQFGVTGGTLDTAVSGITDELDGITDSLEGWENKTTAAFEGVVNAAESEFKEFQTVVEDYETEIENLITGVDNVLRTVGETQTMDFTQEDDKKGSDPLTPTTYTPPKTYTAEYTPPKTYVTNTTTYVAPKTYVTNTTVYTPPKAYTSKGVASSTPQLNSKPNTRVSITQMATGGYTGAWGSEGRLALLHQKELVLNAMDTENVLSAINIVRDISKAIDLRVAAQQGGLNAISKAPIANTTTQTLQQEVTIHAEFPNATQRNEIEAAFDTLLNRASQFANRKV